MKVNDIERCGEYGGLGGSCITPSDIEELWKLHSEVGCECTCDMCSVCLCCICTFVCTCNVGTMYNDLSGATQR